MSNPTIPDAALALNDRYQIEREIGAGGMAVVYLARDKKLDREVALKILRPELGAVLGSERFLAEIKISARLDHPHILTLIDSGNVDGRLYYVLPFVRGESLRAKLDRERQLGLDEALTITRQVASALDYAHRQGLVHRDIKPENILLQEGEAMLTDFGIALAVTEAGGNRLTQTGLSLGTPQYMSPEQATGDRGVDARSDVYSLASVLYEMLAGEPPVTGANAQSMIAKLMTEKPTRLRVLRDTIPEAADAAVAKALAKTPADRFATAGDFMRALDAANSSSSAPGTAAAAAHQKPRLSRSQTMALAAAGIALAVLGTYAATRFRHADAHAVLGAQTQLTTNGAVLVPAISPDGKQLAYVTRHCTGPSCTYDVVVQDVGGSTTRSIFSGATAVYYLEWSPDRRNLVLEGTVNERPGTYLLSALGGDPRFLTPGVATFYAGGDSLLIGPATAPGSVSWIRVAGLDGNVRDSLPVRGEGGGLAAISNVPGTQWIVTLTLQPPHGLWQVLDRSGKVADHVVNACTCGGIAARDAVWLQRQGDAVGESIVRVAIDRETGHLSARQDTMTTGLFTNFSVTADGASMVRDQGTYTFGTWELPLADAFGPIPDDKRLIESSSLISGVMSPDGANVLVARVTPDANGVTHTSYGIAPFGSANEAPLSVSGTIIGHGRPPAEWVNATSILVGTALSTGMRLSVLDARTSAVERSLDLPDSLLSFADALPGGWAWIPAGGQRIVVRRGTRADTIRKPAWYARLWVLRADAAHARLIYAGFNATGDSLGVGVVPLNGGAPQQWASLPAETGEVFAQQDGSLLVVAAPTQESRDVYRVTGPGMLKRLGTIGRPATNVTISGDGARATVMAQDYRADAWLSTVVRR